MAATSTTTRTDQDIQSDVLDELAWEPRVRPSEIGVTVTEGVVTLTGWVDSYAKKYAAERAAHRVARVRAVANDLTVRLPGPAQRTDAELAMAVTRALEWDAFVPVAPIDVTVADGWVTLHGEVEWEYQRRAVERAVGRLTGVRGLSNGLTVRPSVRPDASALTDRIVDALARNAAVHGEQVTVLVRGDTVRLEGLVHSVPEREEIERTVWSAPGINTVHNHLTVAG